MGQLTFCQIRVGKRKKRKIEVPKPKPQRIHSGYTLYISENFESIKNANDGNVNTKEVLLALARQWGQVDEQEKQAWQFKADQLKHAEDSHINEGIEDLALPDPSADEWGSKKEPARKKDADPETSSFV